VACYDNSLFVFFSKAMMTCSEQKKTHKWCNNFKELTLELPLKPETSGKKIHPIFISFQASMVCLAFSSHRLWFEVTIYLKTPRENYLSKNIN